MKETTGMIGEPPTTSTRSTTLQLTMCLTHRQLQLLNSSTEKDQFHLPTVE
jgi:hypothetical protein